MATYCSIADVRLIINPNDAKGIGTTELTDADVTSHINRVEGIINSYVGGKYSTPFTAGSIPKIIETICIDLAAYYCLTVLYTSESINSNEWVGDFYNRHIDKDNENGTLDKIQKGKLIVLLDDGTEATRTTQAIKSNTEDYTPTFDEGDPLNWVTDPDKLDDIADAKD